MCLRYESVKAVCRENGATAPKDSQLGILKGGSQ
jgi:hypothetical protein